MSADPNIRFCGHGVPGDRGGPEEACRKRLPCPDHPSAFAGCGSGGLRIGPTSRPATFKLLIELLLDNGAINRMEPAPTSFYLPTGGRFTTKQLDAIESALAMLGDEETETFVSGEESEVKAIIARSADLADASALLDAWFEGEIVEHRP